MPGTLFVIATPIGNLEDISLRALNTLATVDRIVCEDTRVTKKLLFRYEISKPLLSYGPKDVNTRREQEIINYLESGEDIALVTDAGVPGIADPGGYLIDRTVTELGDNAHIVPIPGPSAMTTALSVAGLPANTFYFAGYPPHKKKRVAFFTTVAEHSETVVFYESKHRIAKTLRALHELLAPERTVVILRELTKQHEEIVRTTAEGIPAALENLEDRGEFVIVIGPYI